LEIRQNVGLILGISGGLIVFIIALILIMYSNSDFDQQLITQVDSGVPGYKLIQQIDQDTEKMKLNAQKRLESQTVSKNINKSDSAPFVQSYNVEMRMIAQYDDARKKFANRDINKEQFLSEIQKPKEFLKIYYGNNL
jgi:hypothetical protein